jgi:bacteriocin biosynthesis cyclodehydratase domain-containing protein
MQTEERYLNQIRFFSQFGDGAAVQEQLESTRLTVFGSGLVAYYALSALAGSGVSKISICEPADGTGAENLARTINQNTSRSACSYVAMSSIDEKTIGELILDTDAVIVCLDAPAPTLANSINLATLRTSTPWLIGQIHTGTGWIGPVVIPGQTPCYKCYEFRRNANLENYDEVIRFESRLEEMPAIVRQPSAPPALATAVGSLLGLETLRLLTKLVAPQTLGRVLRLDFLASEMTYHRILRLPRCSACGYGNPPSDS